MPKCHCEYCVAKLSKSEYYLVIMPWLRHHILSFNVFGSVQWQGHFAYNISRCSRSRYHMQDLLVFTQAEWINSQHQVNNKNKSEKLFFYSWKNNERHAPVVSLIQTKLCECTGHVRLCTCVHLIPVARLSRVGAVLCVSVAMAAITYTRPIKVKPLKCVYSIYVCTHEQTKWTKNEQNVTQHTNWIQSIKICM